jgi:dUTP pyrophosphatase
MRFQKLTPDAKTPTYGSEAAAGADLYLCSGEETVIQPGETAVLPTGISVEIPEGHVGLVFARSSLGIKRGLAPANKVGVIDSDYRGEIKVALYNHSGDVQTLLPYERVAQMVIVPCVHVDYEESDSLETTQRGEGGFGSTGRL